MKVLTLTILIACVYGTWAQFNDGPSPPRIQIPGAISLGPKPGNFRQGRVISPPQGGVPLRIKRPGQIRAGAFKSVPSPAPYLQTLDEPQKPVTEEPDDVPDTPSTIQPFVSSASPFTPQQISQDDISQYLSNTSPKPIVFNPPPQPIRLQEPIRAPQPNRPSNQNIPQGNPSRFDSPQRQQPQPARLAPISYRPARPQFRPETRPQIDDEEDEQPIRQVFRAQPTRPQQPAQQVKYSPQNQREKKPVAQVINKYQEENDDGSITWGFENDDGSFKEETIGADCVTRGRYGYVDPDGMKREYKYETGIPCDKAKKEQAEQGFIDYQENKAVLPNGVILDLAAMAKKSRRPVHQYTRN